MATYKQRTANRANAQKSRGPKSEEGKSVARMNAYRHGLTGKTLVFGDEDPKAFDALRAQLEAEFNPRLGLETDLVERLAAYIWRMRRIPVFEAAIIALGCERAASDKRRGRDVAHRFDSELEEVPFENVVLLPPAALVTCPMGLTVMGRAQGHGELIAHLHAKTPGLCIPHMMGVGRFSTTDEAGLLGHEAQVLL